MSFEDYYRCYVLWDENSKMFVGPDISVHRVKLRRMAARFTKKGAMLYIDSHKKEDFMIEDCD